MRDPFLPHYFCFRNKGPRIYESSGMHCNTVTFFFYVQNWRWLICKRVSYVGKYGKLPIFQVTKWFIKKLFVSDDQKRKFQLNICGTVKNGNCPKDSTLCEVSDKSTILQSMSNVKTSTSFDKTSQNVVLKYETSKLTSIFKIVCDRSSTSPVLKVR